MISRRCVDEECIKTFAMALWDILAVPFVVCCCVGGAARVTPMPRTSGLQLEWRVFQKEGLPHSLNVGRRNAWWDRLWLATHAAL